MCEGANFVKLIPSTAFLYSSMDGVLPKIVERTTTGVDESKNSDRFFELYLDLKKSPIPEYFPIAKPTGRTGQGNLRGADDTLVYFE